MTTYSLRRIGKLLLFVVLASHQLACGEREYEWQPMLPEGKADFVVVLSEGITHEEIDRFQEEALIVGDFDEGHWHQPGIDTTMQRRIGDHEAFVVVLDSAITPEERKGIRERLGKSPYVYRVFEDIAPGAIDLSDETPPESTAVDSGDHLAPSSRAPVSSKVTPLPGNP